MARARPRPAPERSLFAVVYDRDREKVVPESVAPFEGPSAHDAQLEAIRTFGSLRRRGWMLVPLTEALEAQYARAT